MTDIFEKIYRLKSKVLAAEPHHKTLAVVCYLGYQQRQLIKYLLREPENTMVCTIHEGRLVEVFGMTIVEVNEENYLNVAVEQTVKTEWKLPKGDAVHVQWCGRAKRAGK